MALHAAFAYPTADAAAAAGVTPGVMRALIQKWRIGGVGEGPAAMWEAIQRHENAHKEPSGPWSQKKSESVSGWTIGGYCHDCDKWFSTSTVRATHDKHLRHQDHHVVPERSKKRKSPDADETLGMPFSEPLDASQTLDMSLAWDASQTLDMPPGIGQGDSGQPWNDSLQVASGGAHATEQPVGVSTEDAEEQWCRRVFVTLWHELYLRAVTRSSGVLFVYEIFVLNASRTAHAARGGSCGGSWG